MTSKNNNYYLIRSSIATSTNIKYDTALIQFKQYLKQHRYKLHRLTANQLDNILVQYIHHLHSTAGSYSTASCTLSALNRLTGFGSQLHLSKLSLKGWKRKNDDNRKNRPPLTLETSTLIAVTLAKSGHYIAGIGTLLAFHCYLRINELCNLKWCDIVFTGDPRVGSGVQIGVLGALRLQTTKTGRNQTVTIIDNNVCQLLKQLFIDSNVTSNSTSLVFNMSSSKYRRWFRRACEVLDFSTIGYTPHSLRHGGVTYDSMKGVPVKDLMLRGRWKSESALTIYVQTASVLLLNTKLTNEMFQLAQLMHNNIIQVMNEYKTIN